VSGCEKDLYEEQIKSEKGKINYVKIDDVPFLIPSIQKFNKDYKFLSYPSEARNKDALNLNLDLEHILEYVKENGLKTYSIVIKKEFTEYENKYFENLHIFEKDGAYQNVIFKYDTTDDTKKFEKDTFTGDLEIYDVNYVYQGVIQYENGTQKCIKMAVGCINVWWFTSIGEIWIWYECLPGAGVDEPETGGGNGSDSGSTPGGTLPTAPPVSVGGSYAPVVPNMPALPEFTTQANMAHTLRQQLDLSTEDFTWIRNSTEITSQLYRYLWDNWNDDDLTNDVITLTMEKKWVQLKNKIAADPNILLSIPCAEVPKWQALIQLSIPQLVKDKIQTLDNQSVLTDYNIQYLEHARGAAINLDYFPVTINVLPINPLTGMQFTPSQFLNYVRLNINNFVNTSISSFSPTTLNTGFNETQIWNSTNPLGAIIHINIPQPAGDGSVVCSETDSNHWVFTTLEVPWSPSDDNADGIHPVSGNREFGLVHNSNGSYTFYTRGVDRMTNGFESIIGENSNIVMGSPFDNPDILWNSLKTKVYNFVTSNGGLAQPVLNIDNKIWRPNWVKVRQVLRGDIPISDLGCD
jgi:hypothetical protein